MLSLQKTFAARITRLDRCFVACWVLHHRQSGDV